MSPPASTGQMVEHHRRKEFLALFDLVSEGMKPGTPVHAVVDNVSSHKSAGVNQLRKDHRDWKFHFTPTSACWMYSVEGFPAPLRSRSP